MKKLRLISLTLAALICSSAISCGSGTSSDTSPDTDGTSDPSSGQASDSQPAENLPPIEKCDNGGAEFTIYAPDWGLYPNYFFADTQSGEVMNDKIYERRRRTEEQLGITLNHLLEGTIDDQYERVKKLVMSSTDEFQMFLTHCVSGVGAMLTDNLLYDWNSLRYADLTKDYWNQSINELMSLDGRLYYAVSDFMLADPNAILFNKQLVEDLALEDPYEIVRSGKWTIEKMTEMSAAATEDLNGDGTMNENDRYGFATPSNFLLSSFYSSAEIKLVSKDSNGKFELTFYNDRTIGVFEKLDLLMNRSGDAYSYASDAAPEAKLTIDTGKTLFAPVSLNKLYNYRGSTVDFGILPYPRYDETQKEYMTNDWSGLMGIPATVSDPDLVGKVAELLAFYSADTTIPAYYDVVLGEKLSRDENSKEMLDIIYGNVIYDPGLYLFGWGKIMSLYTSIKDVLVIKKSPDLASYYKKLESGAKSEIEKFLNNLPE